MIMIMISNMCSDNNSFLMCEKHYGADDYSFIHVHMSVYTHTNQHILQHTYKYIYIHI